MNNLSIKVTSIRTRGNEPPFDPLVFFKTPQEALRSFVVYELAYGARITAVSDTRMECVTRVFDCFDTTIFEGPPSGLAPLIEAAVIHQSLSNPENSALQDTMSNAVFNFTKGNPLLVKLGGGIISGSIAARTTLVVMLQDESKVEALMDLSLDNLMFVFELVRFDNSSLEDAIGLATFKPPLKLHV